MIKPGIHYDLPMSDYIADPCPDPSLSTRIVHLLNERTPTHAYRDHPRLGGRNRAPSRVADFGSACHVSWLGGCNLEIVMIPEREKGKKPAPGAPLVPAGNYLTNDAKAVREEISSRGDVPILNHEALKVTAAMEELATYREHMGIDGHKEASIIWQEDDVWFRVRPDLIIPETRTVWEYKTAACAEHVIWTKRSALPGGYDVKAAMIVRGLKAVTGEDWGFIFLVQETTEPYACNAIGANDEFLAIGHRKIERAKWLWKDCHERGEWPRYGYDVKWPAVPAWVTIDDEERYEPAWKGELFA